MTSHFVKLHDRPWRYVNNYWEDQGHRGEAGRNSLCNAKNVEFYLSNFAYRFLLTCAVDRLHFRCGFRGRLSNYAVLNRLSSLWFVSTLKFSQACFLSTSRSSAATLTATLHIRSRSAQEVDASAGVGAIPFSGFRPMATRDPHESDRWWTVGSQRHLWRHLRLRTRLVLLTVFLTGRECSNWNQPVDPNCMSCND
jgi:hypothetical protein